MNIRIEIVNGDEVAQRVAEILAAKLDRVAPRQRGSEHYQRTEAPDPGDGGRRHRGAAVGGVVDGGELVDETGDES
jgi:hypothetical protein